ncbi:MAG: protein kinase, partial [Planctomycetes bacterium]|nr:protein kinase [Planctomycetota bacterium]
MGNPDRSSIYFQRLEELFEAAVVLPPEERAAFAATACAGDRALEQHLLAMLQSDLTTAAIEAGTIATARDVMRQRLTDAPLPDIDGFVIHGVLGAGGMGIVYDAEQKVPPRRVALKVMAVHLTCDARARFEREAALLARLDHPNIARVFVAGETSTGQPYFAMERITGPDLDAWLREGHDLRARLALLRKLCLAVEHAHQRGVVHRDLKPSNVLVAENDEPKILDFGVGRAIDAEPVRTQIRDREQLVGTLPYMSPEQLGGQAETIDTRTDIYALGVLIYESLCGRLPFDITGKSVTEALATLLHVEPTPLGRKSRHLRGDLEAIAGMAIAREPERRYGSASVIADDIGRYLRGYPVSAHPPSRLYLLQKALRRHRGIAIASAVAAIALIAGLWVSLMATRTARLAEQDAVAARDRERGLRLCDLAHRFAAENPGLAARCVLEAVDTAPREAVLAAAARVAPELREWATLPPRGNARPAVLAAADDSPRLAIGYSDGTLVWFDLEQAAETYCARAGESGIVALTFAADGALWSGAADGTVHCWSSASADSPPGAAVTISLPAAPGRLQMIGDEAIALVEGAALRLSRDGTTAPLPLPVPPDAGELVALSADAALGVVRQGRGLQLVQLASATTVASLEAERFELDGGGTGICLGSAFAASFFEVAGQNRVTLPDPPAPYRSFAMDRAGRWLAAGLHSGVIFVFARPELEAPAFTCRGHAGVAAPLVFSADGAWLCSAGQDGTTRIWRTAVSPPVTTHAVRVPMLEHGNRWQAFDHDGRRCLLVDEGSQVTVHATDTGAVVSTLATDSPVHAAAFGNDDAIAALLATGELALFDARDGTMRRRLGMFEGASCLVWSPARDRLLVADRHGASLLGNDRSVLQQFECEATAPYAEFAPDGNTVLLVDQRVRNMSRGHLFATASGARVQDFLSSATAVRSIGSLGAWSPDGRWFVASVRPPRGEGSIPPGPFPGRRRAAMARLAVTAFDTRSGERVEVDLGEATSGLRGVAWSPDGRTVV